ncbi:hypothetical protein CYLTODRAFT_459688 [Cylindrobasidium torrendii FP15055 ss-10]|uniref:Uncharacterized protein n=1 Tax=Cylindrobasidium torrendii FP15055 ss-10 TaxID=1314674 RepID=A0A0D7AUX1_9AGAR|nr:hypothetical protein CYLTODRAFT_459688 [Cylindrobasidium torrendii FP15055 ss-10]
MSSHAANASQASTPAPLPVRPAVTPLIPVPLFRQVELLIAREVRLLLATGDVPGIFHSSSAHPVARQLNVGESFYLFRPPSEEPTANWAPMLYPLARLLGLIVERQLVSELSTMSRRCLPFLAEALGYWLYDAGVPRAVLGLSPEEGAGMRSLASHFSREAQPADDVVHAAQDPIRMYHPFAQVVPFRCALFVSRDLSVSAEYLLEVTEIQYDLNLLESEVTLWLAQAMEP